MKGRFAALLLAVALAACSKAAEAPSKAPANPADDLAVVERCLAEACAFVEETCGRKFARRPTVLVCSSRDAPRIRREMRFADFAPTDAREKAEHEWEATHWRVSAYWDEGRNRILLFTEEIAALAAGGPPGSHQDVLRLVLVHEAAHAWSDRHIDRGAGTVSLYVEEGHAHYVAERAARRWDVYPTFDHLTRGLAGEVPWIGSCDDPLRHPLFASVARTRYVIARAFVARVWAVRGREGVDALLRTPPTRSLFLERADDWLVGRELPRETLLARAIGPLRELVPTSGWGVEIGDVHGDVVLRETSLLPAERRAPLREAFEAGWGMEAESDDSPGRFGLSVLRFRDAAAAAAYVTACRDSTPILLEKFRCRRLWECREEDWNPSPEASGFVCLWTSEGLWATRTVTARTGRYVLQAGVNDPIVRHEQWLLENVLRATREVATDEGEHSPARPR